MAAAGSETADLAPAMLEERVARLEAELLAREGAILVVPWCTVWAYVAMAAGKVAPVTTQVNAAAAALRTLGDTHQTVKGIWESCACMA